MQKIRLDLDSLSVESFETTGEKAAPRGTVEGYYSVVGTCDAFIGTCAPGATCAGCAGTAKCTLAHPEDEM
jgi:hypothetical protein